MKALITGGAGFIGSAVARRLLDEGHSVAVIDDLNDFYAPALKRSNLADIGLLDTPAFHHADICDTERVHQIIAHEKPDTIVHMAARAGVHSSLADPVLYERVNVLGTVNVLEGCRKAGVGKLVFASSSSIYGIANRVPFSEDDHVNLPISPYAATKIAGEKLCFTWSHLYGLRVVCLRFFTVYGPRQRPDLAIRKFTSLIDRGQKVPVFGDGSTGRDYTFIDDIVSGVRAALNYDTPYDVFNLGNSSPVTLSHLIRLIEDALGKKAVLERLPDQPGDVPITFADISKSQRLLRYRPATPLAEGIRKFVDWFRQSPDP